MGTLHSHSHAQLRQLEPPIAGHGVPKSLDSCRVGTQSNYDYSLRRKQSPPSTRRTSVAHITEQSYQEKQQRRKSTSNAGASMTVPSTINGTKANLAEFAAQVGLHWV